MELSALLARSDPPSSLRTTPESPKLHQNFFLLDLDLLHGSWAGFFSAFILPSAPSNQHPSWAKRYLRLRALMRLRSAPSTTDVTFFFPNPFLEISITGSDLHPQNPLTMALLKTMWWNGVHERLRNPEMRSILTWLLGWWHVYAAAPFFKVCSQNCWWFGEHTAKLVDSTLRRNFQALQCWRSLSPPWRALYTPALSIVLNECIHLVLFFI